MASLNALADAAVDMLLHTPAKASPAVDAFLAASTKAPFGGFDGVRERAELKVLTFAMPARRRNTGPLARRLWLAIATSWAASPKAGKQLWHELAQRHRELGVKIPAKQRVAIRRAWAVGRLENAKGERAFAAYDKAKTPDAKLDALRAIAVKAGGRFEFWEDICAALLLLDDPDPVLAASCLAKWKSADNAEPSLYES
ncbi:MAG: hypothetical protein QM831_25575 [Kofleriaceae bacterium]